nr:sugar phosphate isomerase/epimerase [Cytophagales bacterium]
MKLLFFCPLWGSEFIPFKQFLENVCRAGYDGVEMSFSLDPKERDEKASMVKSAGLKLVAQHWETVVHEFEAHKQQYENRLRNLAATQPLFINSQTGKDFYTYEQNSALFELAERIADETGVPVVHETHRGKWSFAAHITKDYLVRLPELKITLDISHWCATAESFLEDQQEAVDLAIAAAGHLHARVGYTEGPQVPDPRIPNWENALNAHLAWWDQFILRNKQSGNSAVTITPEFGAPPYMVLHPATGVPLVDQWEINVWMMETLRGRYMN